MSKESYHHGNLRAALVAAAGAALATIPPARLSLRQLAAQVGVSANAPYTHFASKEELLAAVAEDGFIRLGQAMAAALAGMAGEGPELTEPGSRLAALGAAYLQFGRRHPHLYELMFGADAAPPTPGLQAAGQATFALLRQTIEQAGAEAGDLPLIAWALVHGLVTLGTSGRLAPLLGADFPLESFAGRLAAILLPQGDEGVSRA